MTSEHEIQEISSRYIVEKNHKKSRYFDAIKRLVEGRNLAAESSDQAAVASRD